MTEPVLAGRLRRALAFATGGRYAMLASQLAATVVVARHVAPAEFGITVLGGGAILVAEALRELGSAVSLVQSRTLREAQVRTAFTISLLVTLATTALIVLLAGRVAAFYGIEELAGYLRVLVLGYVPGAFVFPVIALLSREMAFRQVAAIEVGSALAGSAATIAVVAAGGGYLALAWGSVASGLASLVLALRVRPETATFRPSLAAWREVLTFGLHGGATAIVYRLGEALLFLGLGTQMSTAAVGLLRRAYFLAQIPERIVLAGVGSVAMPAFAETVRAGRPLKPAYLLGVSLVSGVALPAMLGMIVVARPFVALLLGPAWADVVPLLRIIVAGLMIGSPLALTLPVLVAADGIRLTVWLALVQMTVVVGATALAAPHGAEAVALTVFLTVPVAVAASTLILRARIGVAWWEIARAALPGVAVALGAAAGPAAIAFAAGDHAHPWATLLASAATAGCGWLLGLAATRHPLHGEVKLLATRVGRSLRRS